MKKLWLQYLLICLLLSYIQLSYAELDHEHEKDSSHSKLAQMEPSHEEKRLVEISLEGQQAAGIKTEILQKISLPIWISAPGEVIPNAKLTSITTPRILAQVIQRIAHIGEHVKLNQPLVRLSSVDMAKAQANLLLKQNEWKRVKQLGKQAVSAKRYRAAEVSRQQAYSNLLAYGMTQSQIETFLKSNDPNKANGEFTLLARRDGIVFSADFIEGQIIEPGKLLYKIVDEKSLWVDAKLSNDESKTIKPEDSAIIQTDHNKIEAEVLQVHHKLDEMTRTRLVRLIVPNVDDILHPGEFVTCLIKTGETPPVLAVDKSALMRMPDGDMSIYIQVNPNHFQAKEVQILRKIGPWRVIYGVNAGAKIVTKGAFFVHSESLKSSFKAHNH